MIDRSQRPRALVLSMEDTAILGNLETLMAYITSGQAREDWDMLVEAHRRRLAAWAAQGGQGTGGSVWLDGFREQGEV